MRGLDQLRPQRGDLVFNFLETSFVTIQEKFTRGAWLQGRFQLNNFRQNASIGSLLRFQCSLLGGD
ncbi:hypothetical protein CPter291_3240 [Collimonas pratensis]|uniref:Uncharacterized protein n=1 Tax=Collimonas pratensis TaxID=279113 RepID=A0ABN4MB61_9BURK|nr:hypothetical protein CPter291_3240 [Collimonas pratensis]